MSLSTITTLATARDAADPVAPAVEVDDQAVTWGKALVSAIPTEVLAAYTAGLALVAGLVTPSTPDAYLPFRFLWYSGWLLATPFLAWILMRRKAKAHSTVEAAATVAGWKAAVRGEVVAPTLAAAAWFTAMPGSPWQAVLSSGGFQIAALIALSVGALLLGLIAPVLTKPTPYVPTPNPAAALVPPG